jgi:hypothetical protein
MLESGSSSVWLNCSSTPKGNPGKLWIRYVLRKRNVQITQSVLAIPLWRSCEFPNHWILDIHIGKATLLDLLLFYYFWNCSIDIALWISRYLFSLSRGILFFKSWKPTWIFKDILYRKLPTPRVALIYFRTPRKRSATPGPSPPAWWWLPRCAWPP